MCLSGEHTWPIWLEMITLLSGEKTTQQNADDQIFAPTVREDVGFGPTNLGLPPEMVEHRVNEALHMLRITDLADRVPHHLSGGEKKRVAIAGVIAMEPQVLVLDEPTAGLDPVSSKKILSLISDLRNNNNLGAVIVTHIIDDVFNVADCVAVLYQGEIIFDDVTEKLNQSQHPFIRSILSDKILEL